MSFLGGGTTANAEPSSTRMQPPESRVIAAGPWRSILVIAWPPALVAWVYLSVGRLGFYPTDEGLIQAWSYRILLGQVPHRDFVSPLPMGSAFVHLVDFAIPGPLFEVSRVVAMAEYAAYAILFAWLIYEIAPQRWGLLASIGAAGSVLVNLNTFPLIAWYTVDGLLFIATGYILVAGGVRRRSTKRVVIGFLVLGLAATTKQSFAPATAFGWVLLLPWLQELDWVTRVRKVILSGILGALPSVAFIVTISVLGGLSALRMQLLGAGFVYGRSLVAAWSPRHDLYTLGPLVAAAALLLGVVHLWDTRQAIVYRTISVLSRVFLTALVIGVPMIARLGLDGNDWGVRILWIAVAAAAAQSIRRRRLDVVGIALLGAAWMGSLSYGYAWPNLMGGSMVLYVLHRAWSDAKLPGLSASHPQLAPVAIALLTLVAIGYVFDVARQQRVYLDRPANQLTASLQDVSPAFGDIHTNPETAVYLAQMANCIRQYPARQVAVLPENAAIYPALNLRNPFPIDWMWPDSMHGSEARILATTDRLNRDGDYAVLFQTIGEPELVSGNALPNATLASPIHTYSDLPIEIYDRLGGQRTTCGTFLVVYSPVRG